VKAPDTPASRLDISGATVFLLCPRAELTRERLGYVRAFARRGVALKFLDDAPGAAHDLAALGDAGIRPDLILHPDPGMAVLPAGLERSPFPTACFQIDSFVAWRRRARWAQLYDRAFVFHASDVARYRAAGHPSVVGLFHAAEADDYQPPDTARDLEVAMVGRTGSDGPYLRRLACMSALEGHVRANEWRRPHRTDEAAALYARAKIVLNVGRDDWPTDVGVRYGEAMIAGALFATALPTELTDMGFVEGRDFAGFHGPEDVTRVCRRYLDDDEARVRVARTGQAGVIAEHTYDRRVATIMEGLDARTAPARGWPRARVALTRLDYLSARGLIREALTELPAIAARPGPALPRALALLGRAAGRRLWTRVGARTASAVKMGARRHSER